MDQKPLQPDLPPGVELHRNRIRVCFYWNGERYRESLPLPPTPKNIQRAGRLRGEIKHLLDLGVFTTTHFNQYFPDSTRFDKDLNCIQFGQLAQEWMDNLEVSTNTKNEYRKVLNRYWMPPLAGRDITSIRYSELRSLVNGIDWTSPKTRNNALIPLRGVFALAYLDELIDSDPSDRLQNLKHQKEPPDPFSRDELEQITSWMWSNFTGLDRIYACYFELAFWTGMRPSEMLALNWSDIDWRSGYARVEKAQSKGQLNNRTKVAKVRDVKLNDRALHALRELKPLTFAHPSGRVFIAPQTGEPIVSDQAPGRKWRKALRKVGIRHRKAYNTRHTFATMYLMAGATPAWIANQLGNSVIMVTTVYAKWMKSDQDTAEIEKVDSTIGKREKERFSPQIAPKTKSVL